MPQWCVISLCTVILSFGLGTTVKGAGFDCTIAATKVEKSICNDPHLSKLDEILNDLYSLKASINIRDLGRVRDDGIPLHFLKSDTKAEQLEWLDNNRAECFDDTACLTLAYLDRISRFYSSMSSETRNGWSIEQTLVLTDQDVRVTIWGFNPSGESDDPISLPQRDHYLVTIHDETTGTLVDYNPDLITPVGGRWAFEIFLRVSNGEPQSFEIQTQRLFTTIRNTSHIFSVNGSTVTLREYSLSEFSRVSAGEGVVETLNFDDNFIRTEVDGEIQVRKLDQKPPSFSDTTYFLEYNK